jgi:Putative transmembrane protein (PGPGW)
MAGVNATPTNSEGDHTAASGAHGPGWTSRARRWAVLGSGYALLGVGGILLFLPGPGIPLVLGGLALLAKEAPWAARVRESASKWLERGGGLAPSSGPPRA